jgi:hypothetical protein
MPLFVPRPKNIAKTRNITVAITPELYDALERLSKTGLVGKNPIDTAEEMLRRGVEGFAGGDFYKEALHSSLRKQ